MSLDFTKSGRFPSVTGFGYKTLRSIPFGVSIDAISFEMPETVGLYVDGTQGGTPNINRLPHHLIACLYAKSITIDLQISAEGANFEINETVDCGTTVVVTDDGKETTGDPTLSIYDGFNTPAENITATSYFHDVNYDGNRLQLAVSIPRFNQGGLGGNSPLIYYSLINKWKLGISFGGLITIYDDENIQSQSSLSSGEISTDIMAFGAPLQIRSDALVFGSISASEWLPVYPLP
jgi:hypothetical protein